MVTINPADCKPDEVYEGVLSGATSPQPRVMQRLGNGQARGQWKVLTHDPEAYSYYSDIDVIPLVRLVPARPVTRNDLPDMYAVYSKVMRSDCGDLTPSDLVPVLDAVVARLNANGGLPASSGVLSSAADCVLESAERVRAADSETDRWRRAHEIVEQERDQAREQWKKWEHKADEWKARAEAAERERDEAVEMERDSQALRVRMKELLDGVADAVNPPEPPLVRWGRHDLPEKVRQVVRERDEWKQEHDRMVVHGSVRGDTYAAMVRERDKWKTRAEAAERERDKWQALAISHAESITRANLARDDAYTALTDMTNRAEDAERERDVWKAQCEKEAHKRNESYINVRRERDEWRAKAETPTVTRDQVEEQLRIAYEFGNDPAMRIEYAADNVCDLFGVGADPDPVVYAIRESDLPGLPSMNPVHARNFDLGNSQTQFRDATDDEVAEAIADMASDLRYVLAAHRAIEAEQPDPVEQLAEQIESATREAIRQVCADLESVAPDLDPLTVERAMEVTSASRCLAAHVLGQEASDA